MDVSKLLPMEFLKNIVFRQVSVPVRVSVPVPSPIMVMVGAFILTACSAVPIKMECSEIQARMDYQDLSEDQMRFAKDELDACRERHQEAEAKDSSFIEGTEKRFTPNTDIYTDSVAADSMPVQGNKIP
jgi:hypothetical protein